MSLKKLPAVIVACALAQFCSCSRGPTAVRPPSIDASAAGTKAMELYDKNGDGNVAGDELEQAPALNAALTRLDTNRDKGISADEVAQRINQLRASGMGIMSFGFTVMLNGRPLEGASVTFEPDGFLGDDVKAAVATTDSFGTGGPSIPKDQRPTADTPPGIQYGFYLVRISKLVDGKETIPAKYNSQTSLGQEVATDVGEIANRRVKYEIKTN